MLFDYVGLGTAKFDWCRYLDQPNQLGDMEICGNLPYPLQLKVFKYIHQIAFYPTLVSIRQNLNIIDIDADVKTYLYRRTIHRLGTIDFERQSAYVIEYGDGKAVAYVQGDDMWTLMDVSCKQKGVMVHRITKRHPRHLKHIQHRFKDVFGKITMGRKYPWTQEQVSTLVTKIKRNYRNGPVKYV